MQPSIAVSSPLNSALSNWPNPLEINVFENGGELFIDAISALKDWPPICNPQKNSSPEANPLSKPDSEAMAAIANWSPVHGWYPAHCKLPESLVKNTPTKEPIGGSWPLKVTTLAPTWMVIFASVTVKVQSSGIGSGKTHEPSSSFAEGL